MGNLPIGAEQSASVYLQPPVASHQTKLDGEPEEARHRFEDAGDSPNLLLLVLDARHNVSCGVGAVPEAHQRVGKGAVSVHGDVPGDVVEDVGFGKVIERRAVTNRN